MDWLTLERYPGLTNAELNRERTGRPLAHLLATAVNETTPASRHSEPARPPARLRRAVGIKEGSDAA